MKKYFKLFIGLVIIAILSMGAIYSEKDDAMIVMTYNIRVGVDEGINSWENRRDKVALMIKFHHADIFGVQEALRNQMDDLAERLPGYKWIGVGRDDGSENGEFSAIFYNTARFENLKNGTFWLSETPDEPSKGWDAALPRIVTWGEFSDKVSGKHFFMFNTHFDHQGESARANSAKLVLQKVKEIAGSSPAIVTGDFNFKPDAEPYGILLTGADNLKDAMHESVSGHYGELVSFNGFGQALEPGNKIDYIFIKNNIKVMQHGIIGDTFDGNYPSDHMPVVAEVIF